MNPKLLRLMALIGAVITCLFVTQDMRQRKTYNTTTPQTTMVGTIKSLNHPHDFTRLLIRPAIDRVPDP